MKHTGIGVVGSRDGLVAVDCKSCGFIHLDPIPSDPHLYHGKFYREIKPHYQAEYDQDRQWWEMTYTDFLSLVDDAPNHSLLDVGAGTGLFIQVAKHLGWRATGVEPDYNMARASNLIHGTYEELRDIMRGVGMVSAHWVVEHLESPAHFLQWAHDLLAPNGLLMLTIPSDFTSIQLDAMKAVGKPYYWLHHTHINYFNKKSIVKLLKSHKFNIVNSHGSWIPERYLLKGVNYLDDFKLGRELHSRRMAEELAMNTGARRRKMRVYGLMNWGRDQTIVARKS